MNRTGSQFIWVKGLLFIGFLTLTGVFLYVTWWSFWETRDWFTFIDSAASGKLSFALALGFQYGQGPALFLRGILIYRRFKLEAEIRRRTKGTEEYAILEHEVNSVKWSARVLAAVFVVIATVDAWTNIDQLWADLEPGAGIDKHLFTLVVGVVSVFVEEGVGVTFSLASHSLNDIFEVLGFRRIKWLDVFADNARNILSGPSAPGHSPGHKTSPGEGFRPKQSAGFTPGNRPPVSAKPGGSQPPFFTPNVREGNTPMTHRITDEE